MANSSLTLKLRRGGNDDRQTECLKYFGAIIGTAVREITKFGGGTNNDAKDYD